MRIVALALDAYGDQVLRQPMLSALLDAGHSVTLVMQPGYADIVPHLDPRLSTLSCDVSLSSRLRDAGVLAALRDCVDRVRALEPDLIVALRYDRSAVDEWLLRSCAFAERMAYFPANRSASLVDDDLANGASPALPFESTVTRALAMQAGTVVELDRNQLLLQNITDTSLPLPAPRLLCTEDDRSQAEAWIAATPLAGRRYVVVSPAGTSNHSMKRMPERLAAAGIEALWLEHGLATVLAGVESERPHLDQVLASVPSASDHVVQWIGQPGALGPLLGLVANAEAYVGADLGTMHFAGALGRPVVALFGGGHYPRFQPAGPRWAAVTKRLPCFGCEWHCLFDRVRCIDEVSVDTWLGAIRSVLEGQSPKWILDPSGLSESSARAAEPEVARIRAILDRVESDRFERLLLLEKQDAKLREMQLDLGEIEKDHAKRLALIERQDAELSDLRHRLEREQADAPQGEASDRGREA